MQEVPVLRTAELTWSGSKCPKCLAHACRPWPELYYSRPGPLKHSRKTPPSTFLSANFKISPVLFRLCHAASCSESWGVHAPIPIHLSQHAFWRYFPSLYINQPCFFALIYPWTLRVRGCLCHVVAVDVFDFHRLRTLQKRARWSLDSWPYLLPTSIIVKHSGAVGALVPTYWASATAVDGPYRVKTQKILKCPTSQVDCRTRFHTRSMSRTVLHIPHTPDLSQKLLVFFLQLDLPNHTNF